MSRFRATVTEIATFGGHLRVRCAGQAPAFAPGQLALAHWDQAAPAHLSLRQPLFPVAAPAGAELSFWLAAGHPYAGLAPGDDLELAGAVGRALSWSPRTARLLLVAETLPALWPVMTWALAQGWAVTWLWPAGLPEGALATLPAAVELAAGPPTAEMVAWAEAIVLDVPEPAEAARRLRSLCPLRSADFVRALRLPPLPCGFGGCQACWVETRRGRRLACQDGPFLPI
jgi:hypothetical protein